MKGEHNYSRTEAISCVEKAMRVVLKEMKPLITREGVGILHADTKRGRFTVTVFPKSYNASFVINKAMRGNVEVSRLMPILLQRIINHALHTQLHTFDRLSDEIVRSVRARHRCGDRRYMIVAALGLPPATVSGILNGTLYSNVEDIEDGED